MGRYTLVAFENKGNIQKGLSSFCWTTTYNSKVNAERDHTSTEPTDSSAPYFQIIKLQSTLSSLEQKKELYEIDLLPLSFQNEWDLLQALVESKCLSHTNYNLKVQYKSKGEDRYLDVITHHPFLRKCAKYCYDQKRKNKTGEALNLSEQAVPGFNAYVTKALSYMLDPDASYIMQRSRHLIPYFVLENIIPYQRIMKNNFQSPLDKKDLLELKGSVKKSLQKYKNLRGFLIWEKLYQAGKFNYLLKEKKQATPATTSTYFYKEPVLENKEGDLEFLTDEEMHHMAGNDENATYSYYRK